MFKYLLTFLFLSTSYPYYINIEKKFMEDLKKITANSINSDSIIKLQELFEDVLTEQEKKCSSIKGRSRSKTSKRNSCLVSLLQFQKAIIVKLYGYKKDLARKNHQLEMKSLEKSRDEVLLNLNKSLTKLIKQ